MTTRSSAPRPSRTAALGALVAAAAIALTACAPGAATTGQESPAAESTPGGQAETSAGTADPGPGTSIDDVLAEFPAHVPLPELEPAAAERVNYAWTIDYVVPVDEEPAAIAAAEGFGPDGYDAVEASDELLQWAGADARIWAWESEEFRVEIALSPAEDGSALRYVVVWR